ncbi:hypothetical protein LCGC14_2586770, partial [marine sediment metagenome]
TTPILNVHHIDYDKKNCGMDNLVTLCASCNTRANVNRGFWIELYKFLIEKNHGRACGVC